MPVDGSIYVWTHRALGPLWGFFAGFCAWFPGILVLLVGGDTILSLVQGIGVQVFGPTTNWLVEPWQQGIFVVAILLLAGLLDLPVLLGRFRTFLATKPDQLVAPSWILYLCCAARRSSKNGEGATFSFPIPMACSTKAGDRTSTQGEAPASNTTLKDVQPKGCSTTLRS